MFGLEFLKPVLTALALPPVPWIVLMLIGAYRMRRHARSGGVLVWAGAGLVWLSACSVTGHWLEERLLTEPPPLTAADVRRLAEEEAREPGRAAVVVLGAGRIARAPESGEPDLTWGSLERLRYGLRLARQTGLPLAVSGGTGWAQSGSAELGEAEIARRIAQRDFERPVRWVEIASSDTHQNAVYTTRLLRAEGVKRIVLVTHVWHMPRALREFRRAAGGGVEVVAAPMGYFPDFDRSVLAWLPDPEGFEHVRLVLREALAAIVNP